MQVRLLQLLVITFSLSFAVVSMVVFRMICGVYVKMCDWIRYASLLRIPSCFATLTRVAESQGVEGFWVESDSEEDYNPTPEVQLNNFLHRTPKLGILTRAC